MRLMMRQKSSILTDSPGHPFWLLTVYKDKQEELSQVSCTPSRKIRRPLPAINAKTFQLRMKFRHSNATALKSNRHGPDSSRMLSNANGIQLPNK